LEQENDNSMAKTAANEAVNDAQKIVEVWKANPTFSMGEVTLAIFQGSMAGVTAADADVEAKRREMTGLADVRDDEIKKLQELTTRARSGIRPTFGPDSKEYEQAGGTRKSERKKPTRKPPVQS
jgi:hypothetical protein